LAGIMSVEHGVMSVVIITLSQIHLYMG